MGVGVVANGLVEEFIELLDEFFRSFFGMGSELVSSLLEKVMLLASGDRTAGVVVVVVDDDDVVGSC